MPLFQRLLNLHPHTRPDFAPRLALALLVAAASLGASAPAQAGLTVIFPGLWGGENGTPTNFGVATHGLAWEPDDQGRAVLSQVLHGESRGFRLPTGPGNSIETGSESATSGVVRTTTSGKTVAAHASLDLTDVSSPTFRYPVAAMTTPFQNHARAFSHSELEMEQYEPVTINGQTYPAFSFYKYSNNGGEAISAWLDAWTGTKDATGSLKVALDGGMSINPLCGSLNPACGYTIPPGITNVHWEGVNITFEATFAVFDLDWLLPCEDVDFCGNVRQVPAAVAMVEVEYDGDREAFQFDQEFELPYQVTEGHRYVSYGVLKVLAGDGADIDFFNTMRLAGTTGLEGAVRSATVGDLASFLEPGPVSVPEPGTAALCLAALMGVGVRSRRRAAGKALADDSARVNAH